MIAIATKTRTATATRNHNGRNQRRHHANGQTMAEVCFYGSPRKAGWLASLPDGRMLGDGEPKEGVTMNDAYWAALLELCCAGYREGLVRVFESGGNRMAMVETGWRIKPPSFRRLPWQPAIKYVISAEAIIAAASDPD
jgi:hypothetical protein